MPTAIPDTSPLIYLSTIGCFSLLEALFDSVLVPPAVWTEVVEQGEGRPGCEEVKAAKSEGTLDIVPPHQPLETPRLRQALEPGEREALSLALEQPAPLLLIDEHAGRQAARRLNVPTTGTVGLLLRAKREGIIPKLAPALDELKNDAGFWISDALYEHILAAAHEHPPR